MKYATAFIFALACMLTAACGGGEYQAPPKGNDLTPHTGGTGGGTGGQTKREPTGPSQAKQFNDESAKAKTAWKAFKQDKTKDNYVVAMVHMYNAMRYKNIHEANGHSSSTLSGYDDFRKNFWADKSKTAPPAGATEDPRYVEAHQAYSDSQGD